MQRKDREITDFSEMESVIKSSDVCRIGLCDGDMPYVVPVNFGYRDMQVYVHCAKKGRKLDIIAANNNVCVEFEKGHELKRGGDIACDWGAKYMSVIGFGRAELVEDAEGKLEALKILMAQYDSREFVFSEKDISKVAIIKISLSEITGKKAHY